ncbi:TPA: KH domain-containing protein [Candidatus Berkelbacteria bacterium]|uniref:Single-stranded nucleic acid binding R3H domain-containing protein, spoIIIJ-associated protein n=1 Tax=Berkelbacteria bacterium GW2011_GWE1_39_12 TaxID=1618337 RepID=A0A0G4B2U2_9BACT|nr:MAG: single-stranded nucleic acid binding R3H domain-containing protein, spoIIIJ-associated protein [Berkelbacteria bacterium GW2011_GWE1_39_12]HBO60837.1 KH domain-containing protein [Candidatus Berkelbacteria bacterium]
MPKKLSEKELQELVLSVIKFIDPNAKVEVEVKDNIRINIVSEDSGMLIGKFGQTLESLQYVIRMMLNKAMDERVSAVIDVAGYKANKEKELEELALATAENVRNSKYAQDLRPMNAYERRIVHTVLTDFEGVEVVSEGEEPMRFIKIKPKE